MTYVKKRTLDEVKREAEEYARFQHKLARLRKINFEIRSFLEKIRDLHCQKVDEYRRKHGGRKDKRLRK